MHKLCSIAWGKPVCGLWDKTGKTSGFYTTVVAKTGLVIANPVGFYQSFAQSVRPFYTALMKNLYLLLGYFSAVFTGPITTTKLNLFCNS
jgi:hypothetical protein